MYTLIQQRRENEKAYSIKNNLENLYTILSNIIKKKEKGKVSDVGKAFLSKFYSNLKKATIALEKMKLRDYVNLVIFNNLNEIKKLERYGNKEEILACYEEICALWIKIISPITPHIAEELHSKISKKYVSLEPWPKIDKKKINKKAEFSQDLIQKTITDLQTVFKLVNIKPKTAKIFISENWKYSLFKKIQKQFEKTRNPGEIIRNVVDDKHGKEIAKIVTSLVKDPSKLPETILNQKTELSIIDNSKDLLEKEFNIKIEIIPADKSEELKAKQASPGKVAIIVE